MSSPKPYVTQYTKQDGSIWAGSYILSDSWEGAEEQAKPLGLVILGELVETLEDKPGAKFVPVAEYLRTWFPGGPS